MCVYLFETARSLSPSSSLSPSPPPVTGTVPIVIAVCFFLILGFILALAPAK
jgi:hypothetical protein